MRIAALPLIVLMSALAGCQGLGPAPDVAGLPHASITGTHLEVGRDRVDTFRLLTINGHNVLPVTDEPARLIGKDATDLIPAGATVHVEFEGFAFYDNTVRRLFWDPLRVEGGIDFVPAAGARYVLHGTITPPLSSVWLEDEATHAVVGQKQTKARDLPPADAASTPQ